MNKQRNDTAARIAHALTADLWHELPGGDTQKEYWQNQLQEMLTLFDLARIEFKLTGFKLVREAWRTAFGFYSYNLKAEFHTTHDSVLICIPIAKRLLEISVVDLQTLQAFCGWMENLSFGALRATYEKN